MNCVKCQYKLGINDRICPRCKFMGELQDVVDVTPPRAGRHNARQVISAYHQWRLHSRRAKWIIQPTIWHVVAGVIPGLGHMLSASLLMGICLCALIFWLAMVGFNRGDDLGQLIIGAAAALHAYTLYDLVPLMYKQELATRLKAMACTGGPLLLLVYFPLTNYMNRVNQNYVMVDRRYVGEYYLGQIVGLCLLAFVAFIISGAASGLISLIVSSLTPRKKQ